MTDLADLLAIPAFRRAIVLLLATGASFPLVGVALLKLDLVPARFAVLHAAVFGATVVAGLGGPPLLGALAASVATGLIVTRLSLRSKGTPSGILAAIMSLSLAMAFVAASWLDLTALQALSLLWGDPLAATPLDAAAVLALCALLLASVAIFYKDVELIVYSPRLARDLGYPVTMLYGATVTIACVAIAIAMRLTGALLVDGITVLPALAATFLARSFLGTLALSVAFGLAANLSGLALAVVLDLPTSAAIILCASTIVAGAYLVRSRS